MVTTAPLPSHFPPEVVVNSLPCFPERVGERARERDLHRQHYGLIERTRRNIKSFLGASTAPLTDIYLSSQGDDGDSPTSSTRKPVRSATGCDTLPICRCPGSSERGNTGAYRAYR